MDFNNDNERPIFLQVAQMIEDAIITGAFSEESQVPSIADFAIKFKINPGTVLKGVTKLTDDGVIYKKRGIGMFVATGAAEQLQFKRREQFLQNHVDELVIEAKRLTIGLSQVQSMIETRYNK